MKKITFEISDEAYQCLLDIQEQKNIEFRNMSCHDLPDIIKELDKYDLIENNEDAWHLTYRVSEFGKEILKNN